jgi:hypothetical protein
MGKLNKPLLLVITVVPETLFFTLAIEMGSRVALSRMIPRTLLKGCAERDSASRREQQLSSSFISFFYKDSKSCAEVLVGKKRAGSF